MSLHDAREMVSVLIAQTIISPSNLIKKETEHIKKRQLKRKKVWIGTLGMIPVRLLK